MLVEKYCTKTHLNCTCTLLMGMEDRTGSQYPLLVFIMATEWGGHSGEFG